MNLTQMGANASLFEFYGGKFFKTFVMDGAGAKPTF